MDKKQRERKRGIDGRQMGRGRGSGGYGKTDEDGKVKRKLIEREESRISEGIMMVKRSMTEVRRQDGWRSDEKEEERMGEIREERREHM